MKERERQRQEVLNMGSEQLANRRVAHKFVVPVVFAELVSLV